MLTKEFVQSRYEYKDGHLIAKFNKGNVKRGDIVGKSLDKDGYKKTSIKNKKARIHRLIFLWHNGYLPEVVDHINGDKLDNRIENLRAANPLINSHNKVKHRQGIPPGVSYHSRDKRWQAYKPDGKKRIYLGYFDNIEQAKAALC
jgi:hypothetical protein